MKRTEIIMLVTIVACFIWLSCWVKWCTAEFKYAIAWTPAIIAYFCMWETKSCRDVIGKWWEFLTGEKW